MIPEHPSDLTLREFVAGTHEICTRLERINAQLDKALAGLKLPRRQVGSWTCPRCMIEWLGGYYGECPDCGLPYEGPDYRCCPNREHELCVVAPGNNCCFCGWVNHVVESHP